MYNSNTLSNCVEYQKQFHFLIDNDIETVELLQTFKENAENKISDLTLKRSRLYSKPETKLEIEEINEELRELRKDVRTCNNIFEDAERIREHTNYVSLLEQEAKEQNKSKNRSYIIR